MEVFFLFLAPSIQITEKLKKDVDDGELAGQNQSELLISFVNIFSYFVG